MPQPIRALLRGLLGACGGLIGCPVHVCVHVHVYIYVCVYLMLLPPRSSGTSQDGQHIKQPWLWCQSQDGYMWYLRYKATRQLTAAGFCLHTMDFLGGRRGETRLTLWRMDAEWCVCEEGPPVPSHNGNGVPEESLWLYVLSHTSTPSLRSHLYVPE